MGLDEVTAHAHERLGMEIQAVTLLGARLAGPRRLEVWSLMTEHGWFWLVEGAGAVELFRSVHHGPPAVAEAARRFLELHPTGPARHADTAPPAAVRPVAPRPVAVPNGQKSARFDCRVCGVGVVTRQGTVLAERQQCRRCRHVEQERERYQKDPAHRARLLARKRDQNRVARERDGSYPPPAAGATSEEPVPYDCRTCGVRVTPRRPSGQAARRLCGHCYHVERERERYQNDPQYHARKLATRREQNRVARERGGS